VIVPKSPQTIEEKRRWNEAYSAVYRRLRASGLYVENDAGLTPGPELDTLWRLLALAAENTFTNDPHEGDSLLLLRPGQRLRCRGRTRNGRCRSPLWTASAPAAVWMRVLPERGENAGEPVAATYVNSSVQRSI
jgi:hypothetical protein